MINYIKAHPVNVALSALFILAFGVTTFFLISTNRYLREDNLQLKSKNKELLRENITLLSKNNELMADIIKRNEVIEKSTIVYDSLRGTLQDLNKNIVPKYAPFHVVDRLDLLGQIELLSAYISEADSLRY